MFIKFVEVDAKQPLQPIYVDSRYPRLFVVVRWGYQPITMLRFQCEPHQRTITVERLQHELLQNCGWQLWSAHTTGNLEPMRWVDEHSLPSISVLVCTRDRAQSLDQSLAALQKLDYPRYEVVVVDNCSQDPKVAEVVASYGFRYVREETPGLDWARNRAIAEAQHEIVAFMDDDAHATPGWLRGVAQGFSDPTIMAVTGMVLPAEVETPAQNDFELYGGMNKGFIGYTIRRQELNPHHLYWSSNWGVGANMAFRKEIFAWIGGFDVALDVGTPTNGGGDIEFFYRLVASGYALRYEPAATAYHVHRRSSTALQRQIYNNGRGFGSYLLTIARNQPEKRHEVLRFALRAWIWPWLLKRYGRSLFNGDRWTRRFAALEIRGAFSALQAYRASQKAAAKLSLAREQSTTLASSPRKPLILT